MIAVFWQRVREEQNMRIATLQPKDVHELYYQRNTSYLVAIMRDKSAIGGIIAPADVATIIAEMHLIHQGNIQATLPNAGFVTATSFEHYTHDQPSEDRSRS